MGRYPNLRLANIHRSYPVDEVVLSVRPGGSHA